MDLPYRAGALGPGEWEVVWTAGRAGHQAQAPKNVHRVLTGLARFYLKNAKSPHFNL